MGKGDGGTDRALGVLGSSRLSEFNCDFPVVLGPSENPPVCDFPVVLGPSENPPVCLPGGTEKGSTNPTKSFFLHPLDNFHFPFWSSQTSPVLSQTHFRQKWHRFFAVLLCSWTLHGELNTPSSPPTDAGLQDKMAAKQPPPLMKKHSQTDLVSRLKTRKILGVGGEDDDGEVHRSKISQVLGNEMKFAVREPLGLRVWQLVSAVLFSGIAIMALTFPDQLYDAVFDGVQVTSKTPIRLYGGALLSISLIMWNALYTAEKVIIRWTLLTEACYFSVQFLVVTATLAETGLVSLGILLLLASRLLFVAISVYYYYQVGRKPKKV
ncbi:hypothetical protein EI555_020785 [Monodon monoceros]|uniref:Tumor protein p53-inducible protein 11 n=7 Tax=Odontoceti TaxID=9722 RepID=A0A4U1FAS4_MONMO|nr:hypothetical protein EI555_020785 [Monodon monoceros]